MEDNIINEMDLPLVNPKEELETISNNQFKPLFDVKKFEIRSEHYRDKGIDFNIEIKKNNKYTNFRFVVQLKATERINFNKDGSFSLKIETSNINYLLNAGLPAFYVVYLKSSDKFLFGNLNDFVKSLFDKDSEWQSQPNHTLRFDKDLLNGVSEMYESAFKKGRFSRILNEKLALKSAFINSGDKILFDSDFNLTADSEIRKLIETGGLYLINEGKWKEIIYVHKKGSGNIASSAKYNLVLGIANYYSGHLIDALSFLKSAYKLKNELNDELINHILYFETSIKYSLDFISKSNYDELMKKLEKSESVGLYVKLENAKKKYIESLSQNTKDSYDLFVKDIHEIINHPKSTANIKLTAKCELILFEGYKNNMEYVRGVAMINAHEEQIGPSIKMRADAAKRFVQSNETWYKNLQSLKEEASKGKNYFAFYNAVINEVKVSYELEVYMDSVQIVQDIPGYPKQEMPDNKPVFDRMLEKINNSYSFYNNIGHIENAVVALSTKYEIQHYIKEYESAEKTLQELEKLIDIYDLTDQKKRFELLKNNGTTHQKFTEFFNGFFIKRDNDKKEWQRLISEMSLMDEKEKKIKHEAQHDCYQIHLFPIGYFQFPISDKEKVYEILQVNNPTTRKNFDEMFKSVIPIANIHHSPIDKEGLQDGNLADKGIENWRNIFRIRKAFYENKFYRFDFNN